MVNNIFLRIFVGCRSCLIQKQPPELFVKKDVFKTFANLTRKHLCWSLFFNKFAGPKACNFIKKGAQHRRFPMKFAKLLRNLF